MRLGWVWSAFLAQDLWSKASETFGARPVGCVADGPATIGCLLEWDLELNTKGRYAVMAMVDLAKFGSADSLPLSAIARRQALPMAYLEQIFAQLRKAHLVDSVRGRSGGYRLARAASEISIAEVLNAVEEATQMTRCSVGDRGCVGEKRCLTHALWDALGAHIAGFLSDVTLQDVVTGSPQLRGVTIERAKADKSQEATQ